MKPAKDAPVLPFVKDMFAWVLQGDTSRARAWYVLSAITIYRDQMCTFVRSLMVCEHVQYYTLAVGSSRPPRLEHHFENLKKAFLETSINLADLGRRVAVDMSRYTRDMLETYRCAADAPPFQSAQPNETTWTAWLPTCFF